MRKRAVTRAALAALALSTGAASACGVCVEDKVAAAYDHAVVSRAAERGQLVVFAEPEGGGGEASAVARRIAAAAARVRGVDRASIRTSPAPAAVSFALDPRAATPEEALLSIAAATRIPGLKLAELRVIR